MEWSSALHFLDHLPGRWLVTSIPNCKALPRDERRSCKRQQSKDLQEGWLEDLQASGPAGRDAWQVQLWLGLFPVSRRQLARPGLLNASVATIREHLNSSYGQLLQAMLLDPALQISLNGPANHRRNPHENLARELLERSSLGDGEAESYIAGRTPPKGARSIRLLIADHSVA